MAESIELHPNSTNIAQLPISVPLRQPDWLTCWITPTPGTAKLQPDCCMRGKVRKQALNSMKNENQTQAPWGKYTCSMRWLGNKPYRQTRSAMRYTIKTHR